MKFLIVHVVKQAKHLLLLCFWVQPRWICPGPTHSFLFPFQFSNLFKGLRSACYASSFIRITGLPATHTHTHTHPFNGPFFQGLPR